MKTLILCVDRDDDLGEKGGTDSPIVGRRANVDAATALGLADPEDSDVNAVFAAVHLYDRLLSEARPDDQYEVATITGHPRMGVRGDRKLTRELEEVLDSTRADQVIVVTDGAEDERIMPIIQSRIKVLHVHRSVVKQAPRLEGFYYVLTRLLDDRKQALRFVLPIGIILLVWGLARLWDMEQYATGATLAIAGGWLIVHAMNWEDAFGRFFHDLGEGVRSGKVAFLSMVIMLGVIALGGYKAFLDVPGQAGDPDRVLQVLYFMSLFLPWLIIGLLVRILGGLFDAWFRENRSGIGLWNGAFTLIALYLIGSVAIMVAIETRKTGSLAGFDDFAAIMQLVLGVILAMAGFILTRYLRSVFRPSYGHGP